MIRKAVFIIVSILLICVIILPDAAQAEGVSYDIIRVNLSVGEPTSMDICIDGNYSIAQDESVVLPRQTYTVSMEDGSNILGDVNKDGNIDITDYTLTRLKILGLKDLSETAVLSADVNKDSKIDITDYTLIRLDILDLKAIPQPTSGTFYLKHDGIELYSGNALTLIQHTPTEGQNNFIGLDNTQHGYRNYLGNLEFINNGGTISVVNHIYLEYYLYGVVPYEMSDPWPLEALKSQAVAARNYAAKRVGSSGNYDLTDKSKEHQVYKGYSAENTNAIAAVNATAGQVLKYNGTIIDAYYSASNGGWTDLPYHKWGGGADWEYYVIEQDPYDLANPSSLYETIFLPASGIETSLTTNTATFSDNFSSTDPNPLKAIHLIKQAIVDSGQLAGYNVTCIDDFLLTGISSFSTHTYDVNKDHSLMPWNGVNDCVDKIYAIGNFTVAVGATPYTVTDINIDLRYLDGRIESINNIYQAFGSTDLRVYLIDMVYDGETLTGFNLSQRRYGHGCGLSQRGAQQRANSDDPDVNTYDKILAFYYPNTTFDVLDISAPVLTALE